MADDGWSTFGITIAIDVIIFSICILLFSSLRRNKAFKKMYAPKLYVKNKSYLRPKPIPDNFFGWIKTVMSYNEEEIIQVAGYDSIMCLKIFSFGFWLFLILTIVLCAIILPLNVSGDEVNANLLGTSIKTNNTDGGDTSDDDDEGETIVYEFTKFDKTSLSNIEAESSKLIGHFLAAWFVTICTLYLLWCYHKQAIKLRIEYMASLERGSETHTIFVTDIPGMVYGTPIDRLFKSKIYKLLPGFIRKNVEQSFEKMTSLANEGISAIGNVATNVAEKTIGKESSTTAFNICESDKGVSKLEQDEKSKQIVSASSITDMNPSQWVLKKVKDGETYENVVFQMFKEIFPPGYVEGANIINDTSELEPIVAQYNNTKQKLEDLTDHYISKMRRNKKIERKKTKILPITLGEWATEAFGQSNLPINVDLLDFLVKKLQYLKIKIEQEQIKAKDTEVSAAFVTFTNRWSQVVGGTALIHHFQTVWKSSAAPHPDDIYWTNLKWREWERNTRIILAWTIFILLCLFYIIPVSLIQGILEYDRLEDYAVIGDIVSFPLIQSILEGVLPQLAMIVFLAILPMIITAINKFQGYYSRSSIDFEVIKKYFIFQVIVVFIYKFITGTLLSSIEDIRDDPASAVDLLANSAPQNATFFIYYILLQGFFSGPITFLKIPKLVILWILTKLAGTERAKNRIWQRQVLLFGSNIPRHTIVLFLGLIFCIINPLITPIVFLYFCVMCLFYRYDLIYIYTEDFQTGGKIWLQVFDHVIVALFFMQLMIIGLLGLKKFPYVVLTIPLPLITLAFKYITFSLFDKPLNILSLRAAADLDVHDKKLDVTESINEKDVKEDNIHDRYVNDCFKVDWTKMQELLDEVEIVTRALDQQIDKRGEILEELKGCIENIELYKSKAGASSDVETKQEE